MGFRSIHCVRRSVTDVAVENDQRRLFFGIAKEGERLRNALKIVRIVDTQHIPMIGAKARSDVFSKGDAGAAVESDVIVVVDPAEIVESKMAGKRGRLRADAFHQATVAANGINVIAEEFEARLIVTAAEPFSRDRHADTVGDALAQW